MRLVVAVGRGSWQRRRTLPIGRRMLQQYLSRMAFAELVSDRTSRNASRERLMPSMVTPPSDDDDPDQIPIAEPELAVKSTR